MENLNFNKIKGWEPRAGVGPEEFVKILVEDKMDTEKLENLAKFWRKHERQIYIEHGLKPDDLKNAYILKHFKQHKNGKCPNCNYQGKMGYIPNRKWSTLIFLLFKVIFFLSLLLLSFLGLVTLIPFILIIFLFGNYTPTRFKDRKFCPDCYTIIIPETRSIF